MTGLGRVTRGADHPAVQQAPLRLHWWAGNPNFGDMLSVSVVRHMSGRDIEHAGAPRAELFALGSVLRSVRKHYAEVPEDRHQPWLWGCGLMHPVRRDFLPQVRVALLRGPVTAAFLGLKDVKVGDPGLLARDIWPRGVRKDHIGLVPHHDQFHTGEVARLKALYPDLKLIDVRRDPQAVCREISECAHVYSASLHGLVVADSYGVTNTWIDPGGQGWLKYLDYASGVGREMARPLAIEDIGTDMLSKKTPSELPYVDGIERCREEIEGSFPEQLKSVQRTGDFENGSKNSGVSR